MNLIKFDVVDTSNKEVKATFTSFTEAASWFVIKGHTNSFASGITNCRAAYFGKQSTGSKSAIKGKETRHTAFGYKIVPRFD